MLNPSAQSILSTLAGLPAQCSLALRPHLHQIAIALAVTVLAIFGNDINARVKASVAKRPFLIRTAVFVLLAAFGYGVASLWIASLLARGLGSIDDTYLAGVVLLGFVGVGVLAEQRGHI